MGFSSLINEEQRQHINLSLSAWSVVDADMLAYGVSSVSGFLNTVILNYAEQADASIDKRLAEKKSELEILFQDVEKEAREVVVSRLLKIREAELTEKVKGYTRGKAVKFRINNELKRYVYSAECTEEKVSAYNGNLGKYFKAITC